MANIKYGQRNNIHEILCYKDKNSFWQYEEHINLSNTIKYENTVEDLLC